MTFGRCCICTLSFTTKDVASLRCGHTFHYDCIKRWIENSKTCPNCREKNADKNIMRLFFDEQDASSSQSFIVLDDVDSLKAEILEQKNTINGLNKDFEKTKKEFKALNDEIKKERIKLKKESDTVQAQSRLIQHLETQIDDQTLLQQQFKHAEAKYKASKFYEHLMKKSSGDENEINKYLTATDDIDASKFLSLMKRQISHCKNVSDELKEELKVVKRERLELKAKLENALKKVDGDDKSKKGNRFTAEQDIQNHSFGISYEPELREKHKDINRLDDENYNYFGKNEEYDVLDAFEQDPIDYDRPCSSKVSVKLNINGNAATILKTPKKRSSGEEVIVLSPSIPESFDDQKKAKAYALASELLRKRKFPFNKNTTSHQLNLRMLSEHTS